MGILVAAVALMGVGLGCTSKRTQMCNEGHAKYVEGKATLDPADAEKVLSACEGSCFSAEEADACTKYKAMYGLIYPGATPREPPK